MEDHRYAKNGKTSKWFYYFVFPIDLFYFAPLSRRSCWWLSLFLFTDLLQRIKRKTVNLRLDIMVFYGKEFYVRFNQNKPSFWTTPARFTKRKRLKKQYGNILNWLEIQRVMNFHALRNVFCVCRQTPQSSNESWWGVHCNVGLLLVFMGTIGV